MIVLWLRRWLLLAVGLPVLAWLLDRIGRGIEERSGSTGLTRVLRGAARNLRQFRGRRRGRADYNERSSAA